MKLNESRPNLSRAEYIELLVKKGFDKQHVEVVYDEILQAIQVKNFSPHPEDDIHKVYEIGDLDDIELMDRVCKKLNLRNATQEECDEVDKIMNSFNAEYILNLTKIIAK